jgi:cytochrome P450
VENRNASLAEFRAAREPSGPPPVSLWSVLRGRKVDPYARWSAIRERHGDVSRYRYALRDGFFVSSAEGAKRILQDNAQNYDKEHPSYRMLRRLFGNGLLTSEGDFWLRQRRLAQPSFQRERIASMSAGMTAAALEAADRWDRSAASGAPLSIAREMSRLTLRIVGDALFGSALSEKAAAVGASWEVLNAQLSERAAKLRLLPPILPTKYDAEFRRARKVLFEVVDEIVAAKRASSADAPDLLTALMHAGDHTGERMTDAQLRDEVVTMLLAGHETTAITLTWAWARLALHPPVAEALHAELDCVLEGRAPTAEDIARLPYTRGLVNETLRLHSPAYIINRRVRADDVVAGHRVYRGGSIVLSPLVLHRHPAYWDRPDTFDPARWRGGDDERRRPKFAFIPFSAGPRQCIGNHFSMMESMLILATLAQRFTPRLVADHLPATEYLVLARPAGPVSARIEARSGTRGLECSRA